MNVPHVGGVRLIVSPGGHEQLELLEHVVVSGPEEVLRQGQGR